MGQAKRRGTYQQRKAEAIDRNKLKLLSLFVTKALPLNKTLITKPNESKCWH